MKNLPAHKTRRAPVSRSILNAWKRAATVTDDDVALYKPRGIDAQIADALLAGAHNPKEIGEFCGRSERSIYELMRNPVRTAWISRQVHGRFKSLVGLVDATLVQRAIEGDPKAMALFYQRFDVLTPAPSSHQHVHFDLRGMSTDDLRKIVAEKMRRAVIVDPPTLPENDDA